MVDDVLDVWRVHNEVSSILLDIMPDAGLAAVPLLKNGMPSTGRTVTRNFVHIHEARLTHVGRELMKGVVRLDEYGAHSKSDLQGALRESGEAVSRRLARAVESGERVKGRPGLMILGALIAHESHHRGQIVLALKQSGVRVPDAHKWDIWLHWFKPETPKN